MDTNYFWPFEFKMDGRDLKMDLGGERKIPIYMTSSSRSS